MTTMIDNHAGRGCGTELAAVLFSDVTIQDRFWSERVRVNREATIPAGYEQSKNTGRIDAFRLDWKPGKEHMPHIFWDSDVAKWMEAAAYSLSTHPDPVLDATLDEVISLVAASQQPDGYVNSHFSTVEPEKRWTNLRDDHELYCAGHLMEAAVAHYRGTGKRTFLDVMRRYADYIAEVFGTGEGQMNGYCGHEEIELALVKLAEATGDKKYLRLSEYFVNQRGQQPNYFDEEAIRRGDTKKNPHGTYEYNQSHRPVREQDAITGHAVRATYLYSAMADLARETGDAGLKAACERIWNDLVSTKIYLTGGIGASRHNEGFAGDFDLPNESAYAETCAAIGLVFWAHRMLHLDGDSRYADIMERALYNGVISGVSQDGTRFFYDNPLASSGRHHRQPWFDCACCPPNVTRILASLGGYLYSAGKSQLAVHLYVASEAEIVVGDTPLTLTQSTDYPWDGAVRLEIATKKAARFQLKLRKPGWCAQAAVRVNDVETEARLEKGYLVIDREWRDGDSITLHLDMPVSRVYANPGVKADCGRVALQRGPIVYCLESVDNGASLERYAIPEGEAFTAEFTPDLLGGVVVVRGRARVLENSDWNGDLYRMSPPEETVKEITAIPYYAWDNRAPGEMLVWVREA